MKYAFLHSFLIFALALALCGSIQAEEELHLEEYLPADTLLHMGLTNGKEFCEDMRETGVYQLFKSEEFQNFYATLPQEITQGIQAQQQMMEKQLGLTPHDLLKAFSGHFYISLTDVKMTPQMPYPVVLLSWDLGESKAKMMPLVEMLKQQATMGMPKNLKVEEYEVNGHPVSVIPTPFGQSVMVAYHGNVLMICSDKDYLTSILNGEKPEQSLANSESFQDIKKRVLGNNEGKLFHLNLARLMKMAQEDFAPQLPREFQQMMQMFQMVGLDSIHSVTMGATFTGGQVRESLFMHTPEGLGGILGQIVPSTRISQDLIKFMPKKVWAFDHGYVDLANVYYTLVETFGNMAPREHRFFQRQKSQVEEELGISFEKDILDTLGNEYLLTVSQPKSLLPEVAFQMALKDGDVLRAALDKLFANLPERERILYNFQWQGHSFTYLNYSTKYDPIPVAPTILIEKDRLLLTLYPETAKTIAKQRHGTMPEEAARYLIGRNYMRAQYLASRPLVTLAYRTALPFVQSLVPRSKVPFELALLPSAKVVNKYFSDIMMVGGVEKEGISWDGYSPFGITNIYVTLGAFAYIAEEHPRLLEELFGGRRHRRKPPKRW